MSTAADNFSDNDRLGVAAFGSLLLHMVVILGLGFAVPRLSDLSRLPTLEVTLVQTRSDRAPDEPEFLAQANQDGGGDSDRPDIARNPLPVRDIAERQRGLPAMQPKSERQPSRKQERTALLTDRADKKVKPTAAEPDKKDRDTRVPEIGVLTPPEIEERARLNAEISRVWQEYQKRPKRKFVNARTQEYKYAAYIAAWQAKIERIGNLNYPDEAKRRGLHGRMRLTVAINADGSVSDVAITHSSGHKLLDDAAVRIVQLSAPFAPFPPDIRADADILHITRTWLFNDTLSGGE